MGTTARCASCASRRRSGASPGSTRRSRTPWRESISRGRRASCRPSARPQPTDPRVGPRRSRACPGGRARLRAGARGRRPDGKDEAMGFKLELPDIGEGVVEAEVQQWFVAPGDAISEDQPLVEVMTDKATVVIPSPKRGKVVKLFWNVGDVAKVHAPLIEIELDDAPPRPAPEAPVR